MPRFRLKHASRAALWHDASARRRESLFPRSGHSALTRARAIHGALGATPAGGPRLTELRVRCFDADYWAIRCDDGEGRWNRPRRLLLESHGGAANVTQRDRGDAGGGGANGT